MKSMVEHSEDVKKIISKIKRFIISGDNKQLHFSHAGSHSTRSKSSKRYNNVNISHLNKIISIDKKKKELLIEPAVQMKQLVKETLKHNLLPRVVMEFPTITVGGAIEGAGLESSSFKCGQFNNCCKEYEIVTAEGSLIKASRTKNSDLFYGKTGSYGTLGLLTLIKLQLVDAKKYVHLKYIPINNIKGAINLIKEQTKKSLDYIEGIILDKDKSIIIIGKLTNKKEFQLQRFSQASDDWFYKHADEISKRGKMYEETVPIEDYLFRYDRGAYWMGNYFLNKIGGYNLISRKIFNSSLITNKMYEALKLGNLSQCFFIQDFYIPIDNAISFIDYSTKRLGIFPIWLCPMKPTRKSEKLSPNYNKAKLLINIGIYGRSKKFSKNYLIANRDIEKKATKLDGRKMLYAHSYYPKREFWRIYDKKWYDKLRLKYHADKAFSDVFDRTYVSEKYKTNIVKGFIIFYYNHFFKR
ncbi:FAD-binding protein [Candidatus Woesearchaeota archaeon]|nr:FAD-binding protein [Candidatus Woesearchaeota archaeon]